MSNLVIKTYSPRITGRLIVVGDLHGHAEPIERLLAESHFDPANGDRLLILGDLIGEKCKTPVGEFWKRHVETVKMAIKYNALAVAGNHDLKILALHDSWKRLGNFGKVADSNPYAVIAREMPDDCIQYLADLPHVLHIPQFGVVAVHAGFIQGKPIEKHTVDEVTKVCRVALTTSRAGDTYAMCDAKTYDVAGVPWADVWRGPEIVLFGHDEHDAVQVYQRCGPNREDTAPHAYGLDTRSWNGGNLTGIIFPGAKLVSVPGALRSESRQTNTTGNDSLSAAGQKQQPPSSDSSEGSESTAGDEKLRAEQEPLAGLTDKLGSWRNVDINSPPCAPVKSVQASKPLWQPGRFSKGSPVPQPPPPSAATATGTPATVVCRGIRNREAATPLCTPPRGVRSSNHRN